MSKESDYYKSKIAKLNREIEARNTESKILLSKIKYLEEIIDVYESSISFMNERHDKLDVEYRSGIEELHKKITELNSEINKCKNIRKKYHELIRNLSGTFSLRRIGGIE